MPQVRILSLGPRAADEKSAVFVLRAKHARRGLGIFAERARWRSSEAKMAQLNHCMAPEVETLFLLTAPEHASLSSSAVREIGMFGGDITPFVPACIAQEIAAVLSPECK